MSRIALEPPPISAWPSVADTNHEQGHEISDGKQNTVYLTSHVVSINKGLSTRTFDSVYESSRASGCTISCTRWYSI
jgi:hypothetical protein